MKIDKDAQEYATKEIVAFNNGVGSNLETLLGDSFKEVLVGTIEALLIKAFQSGQIQGQNQGLEALNKGQEIKTE